MKILLVNTSDSGGGAAIACKRLLDALTLKGHEVNLLVMNRKTQKNNTFAYKKGLFNQYLSFLRFIYERFSFIFREKDKSVRFAFSIANMGVDITKNNLFKEADIIHLHWINGGFLSLNSIHKILNSSKPIVWTLHDMWFFTGGCHYAGQCIAYKTECKNCPMLSNPSGNDISNKIFNIKRNYFSNHTLNIVTCSQWLSNEAKSAALTADANIQSIPNPINTDLFSPKEKHFLRNKYNIESDKFIVLFGAANINDKRKGINFLIDALNYLAIEESVCDNIQIIIFGKNKQLDISLFPFKVYNMGLISTYEKIVDLYSMSDLFVLPSLEDNLPNTVMESLSCGTPVVGFNIGGVAEMIDDNINGAIALEISAESLAKAILRVIKNPKIKTLGIEARDKVKRSYNNSLIAEKYTTFYEEIIKKNNS
jgi:glycosyltransferase involved in cell wall biosynthesis